MGPDSTTKSACEMPRTGQARQRATQPIQHARPTDACVPLASVDHGAVAIDAIRAEQFDHMRARFHAVEILDDDAPAQLWWPPRRGPLVGFGDRWPRMPFSALRIFAGSPVHRPSTLRIIRVSRTSALTKVGAYVV